MRILTILFVLLTISAEAVHAASVFTDAERAKIVAYWTLPERYKIYPPDNVAQKGLWQIRLTTDGSLWFWKYQNAIGAAKVPPTQAPTEQNATPALAEWKRWVAAKLAYDRWLAQDIADRANSALNLSGLSPLSALPTLPKAPVTPLTGSGTSATVRASSPPALPGSIPADLLATVGNPPAFANAVVPMQYTITFEDNDAYVYTDNVRVGSPSYAYYRFVQGVMDAGEPLRKIADITLDPLFVAAGFNDAEQRVAKAVSRLEGGFDSVNTYDTGYVSIGFIQFITAGDGRGSLLEVLQQEKKDQPTQFGHDFHQYGIDVGSDGTLVVVDPVSGAELTGSEAVQKTIVDKRLTAVWQRAGRHSSAFRVAQINVAKSHYWPANDVVTIVVHEQTLIGKVADVVKSEAGLATLFDRKVNRGTIAPFADVLTKVMLAHNLTALAEAALYEREIIAACKYRTNFLADPTLSQPK